MYYDSHGKMVTPPVVSASSNFFSPKETTEMICAAGVAKSRQSYLETLVRSILAGIFLSFGGLFLLVVGGGSPGLATSYPGIRKAVQALVFPPGLVFIVLFGAELCTSNFMVMFISTIHRKTSIRHLAESWVITWIGNLMGALLFGGVFVYWSGVIETDPYKTYAMTTAVSKTHGAAWHQLFLRAIGCNYLVCIAIFLATASKDGISKIVSIYLPIWLFVAVGFEHVVANMFIIQMGMYYKAKISVGYYIWHSMIPVTLGNIVAGALFMGVVPWYLYLYPDTKHEGANAAQGGNDMVLNGLACSEPSSDTNSFERGRRQKDSADVV